MTDEKTLAIHGGKPVRLTEMPARLQFTKIARLAAEKVFNYYDEAAKDFGSQGYFENKYCMEFQSYLCPSNSGFADAVCSGTAALYVAIASLELRKESEVLVTCITDPGAMSSIILNQLIPRIIDNEINSPNTCLGEIKKRFNKNVTAILLNHVAGIPISDIQAICFWAKENNIKVIEDVSQAHGAQMLGQRLGTFGDIACFSTMFSKNHSTGGRGGVIYTQDENLYNKVRMYSDKGKPFHLSNFDVKDPGQFEFPALNFGIDEISCSIGSESLKKLEGTRLSRVMILQNLEIQMKSMNLTTTLIDTANNLSPFFGIFKFNKKYFSISKKDFADAISKEGISLNIHYLYIVSEWTWMRPYLSDDFVPLNAIEFRDSTFNLLFNENYGEKEIQDIAQAISKVENCFRIY